MGLLFNWLIKTRPTPASTSSASSSSSASLATTTILQQVSYSWGFDDTTPDVIQEQYGEDSITLAQDNTEENTPIEIPKTKVRKFNKFRPHIHKVHVAPHPA